RGGGAGGGGGGCAPPNPQPEPARHEVRGGDGDEQPQTSERLRLDGPSHPVSPDCEAHPCDALMVDYDGVRSGVAAADSTGRDEPLFPRHTERPLAARAAHAVRRSLKLGAVAAAGAHGIPVAPQRRQAARIARARDDGPVLRRGRDDLDRRARDRYLLAIHLERRFRRRQIRDAIPRTATQPTILVRLETGPPHVGHSQVPWVNTEPPPS